MAGLCRVLPRGPPCGVTDSGLVRIRTFILSSEQHFTVIWTEQTYKEGQ